MNNGIIYFNSGIKLLPRLLVSLHSLRKQDQNLPISLICIIDKENKKYIENICKYFSINIVEIKQKLFIKHHYWFEKSRMHMYSPYDNNIFIDSDTIILNDFKELFDEIEQNDFIATQFSNWVTSGRRIRQRLKQWMDTDEDLVKQTIQSSSPSVNVGVYGFKKTSELMNKWFDFTITHPIANLPEETSCHLLLQKYKGKIVSNIYNASCKFDDPISIGAKIIHFHGRKHCILETNKKSAKYNGDFWIKNWLEVYNNDICEIQKWYNLCGDKTLNIFMNNRNNYEFR